MNAKQQEIVDQIKKGFFENHAYGDKENYEYKKVEIEKYDTDTCNGLIKSKHYVDIFIKIGMKEDEGTLAVVLCRPSVHVHIGPKGGITILNPKYKNKKTGLRNAILFGSAY